MSVSPQRGPESGDTVVSAIDPTPGSPDGEYVIADISTDDAWLSMEAADAPALSDWR